MSGCVHAHIELGGYDTDEEGTEYANLGEARAAAVSLLGAVLRDKGDAFWEKPEASVTVMDEEGLVLWKIETLGSEGAAVRSKVNVAVDKS